MTAGKMAAQALVGRYRQVLDINGDGLLTEEQTFSLLEAAGLLALLV